MPGGLESVYVPPELGMDSPANHPESGPPSLYAPRTSRAAPYCESLAAGQVHQYEIARTPGGMFGYPSFQLTQGGTFVLAARKRKKTATPHYVISASADMSSMGANSACI